MNKPRPMNAHNSQEKHRFSSRGDFTMSRALSKKPRQRRSRDCRARKTVILISSQVHETETFIVRDEVPT